MKLRILCLHGFAQSAEIFRIKTGGFRKMFKKIADFEFLDAPFEAETGRTWFIWQNEKTLCLRWDESLDYVTNHMNDKGPYDGILAFSMGGSLASIFGAMCQKKLKSPLRFMIIIGAPLPLDEKIKDLLQSTKIDIPVFFIHGEKDEIIPMQRGEALMSCFSNAQMHKHSGGHAVPMDKQTGSDVNKFLTQFIAK